MTKYSQPHDPNLSLWIRNQEHIQNLIRKPLSMKSENMYLYDKLMNKEVVLWNGFSKNLDILKLHLKGKVRKA
jgi:hypothetical protein